MVQLEVTLTGRSKSFTGETLQDCAKQFFDEFGEASKEVVKCHTFEVNNPKEFLSIGGNESCIGWLKQMQQGVIDDK
tara:strand:- start:752 stop:982 length:231 start_codon:yes stop_codon:yes gene_type:complete